MSDLDALRAWHRAKTRNRQLALEGVDGAWGVALRQRIDGVWFGAAYASVKAAALAIGAGFVRWRRQEPLPAEVRRGTRKRG